MKKILNICVNGLYTDGYTYHENLLPKYHKKLGYDVYILASEYEFNKKGDVQKSVKKKYMDKNGIKIRRLEIIGGQKITCRFKKFKNFYAAISDIAPDIIFCHLFQFLDVREVIRYKKENPAVKVYFDSHADKINSAHGLFSALILHKIIWRYYAIKACKIAEWFYGVSPARVEFLRTMYNLPEKKTRLLVMGTDDETAVLSQSAETKKATKYKYRISEQDFLIVTGGKLDASKKQVLNLIRVVSDHMLKDMVKLIVFGSISDDLMEEIRDTKSDKVQYIGWIDEKTAYELFAITQLAVFPSTHSVYWEQVAGMGVPMIVKYWKGFEHIDLGGNIRYLYESSEAEIRKVIMDAMENTNYAEMVKAAREKGMVKFSYMHIAKESIMGG
jgi:hypothetical protein